MVKYVVADDNTELRPLTPEQMQAIITLYEGNCKNKIRTVRDFRTLVLMADPNSKTMHLHACLKAVECVIEYLDKLKT